MKNLINYLKFTKIALILFFASIYIFACGPHPYNYNNKYVFLNKKLLEKYSYQNNINNNIDFSNEFEWRNFNNSYLKIKTNIDNPIPRLSDNEIEIKINNAKSKIEKEGLSYLKFVNKVRPYVGHSYYWESLNKNENNNDISKLIEEANLKSKSLNGKSEFLSLRYGFQAVRLSCIANDFENCVFYYKSLVAPLKSKSIIKYWAMGYFARALYMTGNKENAILLYCDIFDQCPPMMETSLTSIKLIKTEKIIEKLKLKITNKHKKATLTLIEALCFERNYSAKQLEDLIKQEPKSNRPEYLLTKYINDIEKYNNIESIKNFFYSKKVSKNYKDLINICNKRGNYWVNKHEKERGITWYLSGMYLSCLDFNKNEGHKLLKKIKKINSNNKQIKKNLKVLEILFNIVNNNGKIVSKNFDNIANAINSESFNKTLKMSLNILCCEYFYSIDDLARTILLLNITGDVDLSIYALDNLASQNTLIEIETLKNNLNCTEFDKYLLNNIDLTKEDCYFLRGVFYIREEKYKEAINVLKKITEKYWLSEASKDFYLNNDKVSFSFENPELDKNSDEIEVTYYDFALLMYKLIDLSDIINNMDKSISSELYYKIGNIYYSLNENEFPKIARGRHWILDPYHYLGYLKINSQTPYFIEQITPNDKDIKLYLDKISNFKKAKKYYKKVLSNNINQELSAKCCILMETCDNIYLYKDMDKSKYDLYYFRMLSEKYKETQFFESFLKQCPLLKDFL